MGFCDRNPNMKNICKKTCGKCVDDGKLFLLRYFFINS